MSIAKFSQHEVLTADKLNSAFNDLETAMESLPDGQAVSATVAIHTTQISNIQSEVGGDFSISVYDIEKDSTTDVWINNGDTGNYSSFAKGSEHELHENSRLYGGLYGYHSNVLDIPQIVFLDADKSFISGIVPSTSTSGDTKIEFDVSVDDGTIPSNAKYFVIQSKSSYADASVTHEYKDNGLTDDITELKSNTETHTNEIKTLASEATYNKSKLNRNCGIIAFIFDDSLPYSDSGYGLSCEWIITEFENRGLKLSVALANKVETVNLAKYKKIVDKGHGILSHSKSHLDMVYASEDEIKNDCINTLNWLIDADLPCRGFVYPNNSRNDTTDGIIQKYYGYAFAGQSKTTHITKDDALYSLSRFGAVEEKTVSQVEAAIDECIASSGLLVIWGHGYRIGSDSKYMTKDDFITILDYISTKNDNFEIIETTVDKAMDKFF